MAIKTENIGWGLSFAMVCKNYYAENNREAIVHKKEVHRTIKKVRKIAKGLGWYDNPVLMEKEMSDYEMYLMHQTPQQFELAKKYGWKLAKQLTEQQDSFD